MTNYITICSGMESFKNDMSACHQFILSLTHIEWVGQLSLACGVICVAYLHIQMYGWFITSSSSGCMYCNALKLQHNMWCFVGNSPYVTLFIEFVFNKLHLEINLLENLTQRIWLGSIYRNYGRSCREGSFYPKL